MRQACIGIRPEHVIIDSSGSPCIVEHTELLGSYNLIELRFPKGAGASAEVLDRAVVKPIDATGQVVKARVAAHQRFNEGEKVRVRFAPQGVRWFDPATEKALDWRTPEVALASV
jgi:ABC-type sugar transport system ATPase subunit